MARNNVRKAKQSYAYTPGLKIKKVITLSKRRTLPIPGDVLVEKGDIVDFDTVVARSMVPGDPYIVEATNLLGLEPDELPSSMVKKIGEKIEKDEIIAQYITFFGFIKRFVYSPIDGVIESISPISGRITLREHAKPIEVKAYIPGKVVETMPKEGVVIETNATFIQGIFGIGGEKHGRLEMIFDSPDEVLTAQMITSEHEGKIIVGGSFITLEAIKMAIEKKVSGIVVGGINAADLNKLLGYTIGVAITGEEEVGLTLMITEGFGKMMISQRTFEYLASFNGEEAAINGATQIRAGVLRPELIIPHTELRAEKTTAIELGGGIRPTTPVRIIREPYFGRFGTVVSLPIKLQKVKTESLVRVIEVKLENGRRVMVPRANVEIIEE